MKKKVLLLSLVLSLVLTASACGTKKDADNNTTAEATAGATTDAAKSELASVPTGDKGEVELGDYKGITVEYADTAVEVTDEEVQTKINSFLEENKTSKDIKDRAVKKGDVVNIDYKGTVDGEAFDGGTAEGYDLTIGSNSFIDGFENGLIDAKIGKTVKLNLTFPDDYSNTDLAGKAVVFEVTVNSIRVEKTPELTDELVAKKTDYKTVDEYKAGVKADLLASKQWSAEHAKWDACWAVAVDNATVKTFAEDEIADLKQEMIDYYTQYAQYYSMELEDYVTNMGYTMDQFQSETDLSARDEAKKRMVADKIAEAENITLSDDEYKEGVSQISNAYGYESDEALIKQVTEERLKEDLLTYKIEKFICDNATIVAPAATEAPASTAATDDTATAQ